MKKNTKSNIEKYMEKNLDCECICCARLYYCSCCGVQDRGRTKIDPNNACIMFVCINNENDCLCDIELYDYIVNLEKQIGLR